jgi:hypothetical protein
MTAKIGSTNGLQEVLAGGSSDGTHCTVFGRRSSTETGITIAAGVNG